MILRLAPLALAAALAAVPALAQQPHDHGQPSGRVGTVHFPTSCAPAVEKTFDRAVAMLHSFWFSAAIDSFNEVLAGDPGCAPAYWGIAMSWWGNPFGGFRSPQALTSGAAAIEKARVVGSKTARERDYIEAVATLFQDVERRDQRTRALDYEHAMAALAERYPTDVEARIFYALALDQTALPSDKTYANQLKAAAILEKEFASQPDHPGLAHYIIHSYDVPALAPRALDAARRYAAIAPDAPHALHMPSHTFTRVGAWTESIATNEASAAAARKDNAVSEELHALDYQTYAYLQTGQDAAARKTLDALPALRPRIKVDAPGAAAPAPAGFYALAAIPARYALERNAWAEAAALTPYESPFPWTDAITYYARALGKARSGDPAGAASDAARLDEIHDALERAKDAYWTEQVEIQRRVARAWIAFAEERKDEAVAALREAADREDATEKAAVTPGPIKPARELLGEMLLALDRPDEALQQFETAMTKEPRRFRATYGAAQAARAAGNDARARAHFAALLEIAQPGDSPERPELGEARQVVARRP